MNGKMITLTDRQLLPGKIFSLLSVLATSVTVIACKESGVVPFWTTMNVTGGW